MPDDTKMGIPQKIDPTTTLIDELAGSIVAGEQLCRNAQVAQYGVARKRYLRHYECRVEDKTFDWQSNAFLPIIYTAIRTIFPRWKKLLIGKIPSIKLIGAKNQNLEKYISKCMRACKGYLQMADILWEAIVYGTGIGKVYWDSDYLIVSKQVPDEKPGEKVLERAAAEKTGMQDDTIKYKTVEDKKILIDMPVIKWVPLANFTCNFNEARDIEDADCYETMDVDLNYLEMRSKDKKVNPYGWKWGIYDNIKFISALKEIEFTPQAVDPQADMRAARDEVQQTYEPKFNIRLITAQKDFRYDGTFYRNGVVTVAQVQTSKATHNLTLRVQACPRSDGKKNYIRVVYERVPGRFFGRGIPEIAKALQEVIVDFFRSQLDRATLALHGRTFFDINRVADPSMLQIRMGGLSPVDGSPQDIIKEETIAPPDPGSWRVLDTLMMFVTEETGAHKNLAGTAEGAPNRTATGIQTLMQASTERILDSARDAAEEFIPDVGSAFVTTIKDGLGTRKIEFTYLDGQGKEQDVVLDGTSIPEDVEIYAPCIFERADREQQAQKMLGALQYTGSLIGEDNVLELMRTMWEYNELPNLDNMFMPSQQNVPLEIMANALTALNIPVEVVMAQINKMAEEQAKGKPSGGGEGASPTGAPRTPAAQTPQQNQGTSMSGIPAPGGINTGKGGAR